MVALLTPAFITAHLVDADLAAGVRFKTFIDVFATFGVNQMKPSRTETLVADLQVLANMGAASIVVEAFIRATFPERLVRPIPAITTLVTHLLHADTLSTAALKPCGALATGGIDTARFITHVPAVVLMVALAAAVDAGAIAAFKFIWTAGGTSAVSLV